MVSHRAAACLAWQRVTAKCKPHRAHYSKFAYNKSQDTTDILDVTTEGGILNKLNYVTSSLEATCVIFALFAVAIHALAIWRSLIESDQDREGVTV